MTFQIGEKVIYPNHGVATIENISSRAFAGHFERYYLLRLTYNLTVMVPLSHAENVGLRKVTRNGDVSRVLGYLGVRRCARSRDWKDRFRENTEKMKNGSLLEIAEVLKSLLLLQAEKPLSFREKKMLDRSRHLLVSELAIAKGVRESEAETLIERALNKADLNMPAVL